MSKIKDNHSYLHGLAQFAMEGNDWLDNKFNVVIESAESSGEVISCSSCVVPGCCYQVVLASFVEVVPIAMRIHESGLNSEELRRTYWNIGNEMERSTRYDWFVSAYPCVFLEHGLCSVYDDRPCNCRTYYTIGPSYRCCPPSLRSNGMDDSQAIRALDNTQATGHMVKASMWIANRLGLDSRRMWMRALPLQVSVILECFENPNNMPTIIERKAAMPDDRFQAMVEEQSDDPMVFEEIGKARQG